MNMNYSSDSDKILAYSKTPNYNLDLYDNDS